MGIVTQVVWGLMAVFVAATFYRSSSTNSVAMPLSATVTYLWLGRMTTQLVSPYPTIGISQMILDGQIACEMLRPISTYRFLYLKIIVERLSRSLFSLPFIAIIAFLIPGEYRMLIPKTGEYLLLFLLSITLSMFLITAYELCMEVVTFFSPSFHGFSSAMGQVFQVISGSTIPIVFFPIWAQVILKNLPFASMLDTPFMIYLGQTEFSEAVFLLIKQIMWVVALIILGYGLMSKAMRRLEINGG